MPKRSVWWLVPLLLSFASSAAVAAPPVAWKRHTVDDSSKGADGVRAADADGDGLLDLVVGWEQGGVVRVYRNPGHGRAKGRWPAVTVGRVASPEDAAFVDLDGDGAVDVVSCCEGKTRSVFVHWAPKEKARYLDPAAWRTAAFPALQDKAMWMFGLPLQVDGRHGPDLVFGAKGEGARVGWLQAPADARDLAAWRWHPLRDAGWVMSLAAADVDGDGDPDVVLSDRRGRDRGCWWLDNPGPGDAQARPWAARRIGPADVAAMFLDVADLDGDGRQDVVAAGFDRRLWFHRRVAGKLPAWETRDLPFPDRPGFGKAVRVGDLDGDGRPDVVATLGEGQPSHGGAVWLSPAGTGGWAVHDVSGPAPKAGFKPDLIQLIDLDGDGDPDVITTEERAGLGVVWYENPAK